MPRLTVRSLCCTLAAYLSNKHRKWGVLAYVPRLQTLMLSASASLIALPCLTTMS